ncbi:hemagglutinin protein [Roseospira goensis]|uniref:Hemagglutinin protein n=1 Tax=Roseospira goensis TaxID=391922 RepID=A0A7W6RWK6_9PROT|nr:hemagglutinin protein [Roseospira goensis]MBB4284583.1 hypothetical protein [Roseospira goensis]
MTTPSFDRIAPGLYALSTRAESGLPDYWAGYAASTDDALGDQATLAETWADVGGLYLFLDSAPADPDGFLAALRALLPRLSPRGWLRLLWLANPNAPAQAWTTQGIDALPATPGEPAGPWRSVRDARFQLGSYAVAVGGGAVLTAGADAIAVTDPRLAFSAPGGVYPATGGAGSLPLSGAHLGGLTFPVAAHQGETGAGDDPDRLGVMLRYGEVEAASPTAAVSIVDMPLLQQTNAVTFTLSVSFDPLTPLRPERTALTFDGGAETPPVFTFAQRTDTGHPTQVTPLAANGALPGARLSFGRTPLFHAPEAASAAYVYHLAPDGQFALSAPEAAGGQGARMILGTSGAECVVLPDDEGSILLFRGNGAAYVPPVTPDAPAGEVERVLLTDLGTTAHATVLPATPGGPGRDYLAQPLRSPLFDAESAPAAGFLSYLAMVAARLPALHDSLESPPPAWPMGVYARIPPAAIDTADRIEAAALAPRRRQAIGLPEARPADSPAAAVPAALVSGRGEGAGDAPLGVTPNGLIAVLTPDRNAWAGMLFANMPRSATQRLSLTAVGPPFQAALQANQVFTVVSNVDTFMGGSSVAYQLTADTALARLAQAGVPPAEAQAITQALAAQTPPYPLFPTEAAFDAVVAAPAGDYLAQAQDAAGLLRADIEGWTFQLSPRSWRTDPLSPTLMLIKYCARPITDLAQDPAAWGWSAAARSPEGSLAPTLGVLEGIIRRARLKAVDPDTPEGDPLALFYHEVLDNPRWNGVLVLNAPVDFAGMPEALRFLAAGVDQARFFAHHVGFSVTPYTPRDGVIDLGQTAAFGLIDYNDPDDLVASTTIPFGFKTLAMRVRFDNARVVDFSAQAELMVNRLFGSWLAKADRARGNNLILDGSYQRVGGQPSYAFTLLGDNVYQTDGAALVGIDVRDCRMDTAAAPVDGTLTANFTLSGRLTFLAIPGFDLFSYGPGEAGLEGYLSFQGLVVSMAFPLSDPADQTFSAGEAAIAFDSGPGASLARPESLAANFPLRLQGLVAAPDLSAPGEPPTGATPESLGFTSISAPLTQTPLAAPWYGLALGLDMGTLGDLSGAIGLDITLLAAWGPEASGGEPTVYLGLKLGMTNAINGSLPLQGVLKLGFRSFQFETYRDGEDRLAYLLRLRRFALSVLAWSFPPGNNEVLLFGAPGNPRAALGWYAAYAKEDSEETKSLPPTGTGTGTGTGTRTIARSRPDPARLARAGRRTPPVV